MHTSSDRFTAGGFYTRLNLHGLGNLLLGVTLLQRCQKPAILGRRTYSQRRLKEKQLCLDARQPESRLVDCHFISSFGGKACAGTHAWDGSTVKGRGALFPLIEHLQ